MISAAAASIYPLARGDIATHPVMPWTCPVPYFGRLGEASVATLGINPSNREFVDAAGKELDGNSRRFPTLGSLGLGTWADASPLDVATIASACDRYFAGNPYSRWFNILERLMNPVGASYYSLDAPAAHLDLVPWATGVKWGALRHDQRRELLLCGQDLLAGLLRDSSVELLVLNGASVVRQFEEVAGVRLKREHSPSWDLPRKGSTPVSGLSFSGSIDRLGDVELGRSITIAGYNHNLQSSFGVTKRAVDAIARWVAGQR